MEHIQQGAQRKVNFYTLMPFMKTKPIIHFFIPAVLAVSVVLICGCNQKGPNTAQVTGVVKIDAEPAKGIEILFSPKSKERSSIGFTDENGKYMLRFTETKTGCIPGDHVVRITAYSDPENDASQYIPAQYNVKAHENEEMNVTVKKGKQEFNFDITSK